jgi:hypothetical protein
MHSKVAQRVTIRTNPLVRQNQFMKDLLTRSLNQLGLAWWVEVTTENPKCTYYFGPFGSSASAQAHQSGYIEDLQAEGAQSIQAVVKRIKPEALTVCDRPEEATIANRS